MGEVFAGRYELVDLIGHGGMGAVWRARDLKLRRIVAAKVLRQSDASSLLRFVREQGMRVSHPNVLAPLGWAAEDDRVLFTMGVVDGGSVATLMGDYGALPPGLVAEILRQLLSGLEAVHAAHIIHRDIKPANILLAATGTGRPHAYLGDFGIALDLDGPRFTETGLVAGTPGYLAPELMTLGDVSPAVDLYAVGMVGAAMLTALKPRDIDFAECPPHVPLSLWSLLRDLALDEPKDRPTLNDAVLRLGAPELAWHPGAIGDVEVLQQLEPLPVAPPTPPVGYPATGPRAAPNPVTPAHPKPLTPTPTPSLPPTRSFALASTGLSDETEPRPSHPSSSPLTGPQPMQVQSFAATPPLMYGMARVPMPAPDVPTMTLAPRKSRLLLGSTAAIVLGLALILVGALFL